MTLRHLPASSLCLSLLLLIEACEGPGPISDPSGQWNSDAKGNDAAPSTSAQADAEVASDAGATRDGSVMAEAGTEPIQLDPGVKLNLARPPVDQAAIDKLKSDLAKFSGLTPNQLLSQHAVQFTSDLGYDPRSAKNLDLIQASPLKLTDPELAKLAAQGFVITPRNQFPNMVYGYQTIYAADLPVYISLDSILDAVHISYDRILSALESAQLSADLRIVLTSARAHLKDPGLDQAATRDLDVYFAVALSLLEPSAQAPVFAENAKLVSSLVSVATSANAFQTVELFGVQREIDASQFKPRGHYVDSPELQRYFRAMMWLGRTDFRILEPQSDGSVVFRRRQVDAVLALTSLVQGDGRAAFDRIDQAVTAFVGEHDYMQLAEADKLLAELGGVAGAKSRSDEEIAKLIVEKGYGAQRIASQIIYSNETSEKPLPLGCSFALLGQRYVVDSHVFSNVVFDRVPRNANGVRGLPNPLDVAYAAFNNPAALPLLSAELTRYEYAPQLESMHALVAAHESAYWDENLYNLWLSALRAASPKEGAQNPTAEGKPAVTGTEAWSRRMLNTQLASWAQLRRDTILYVKQSYTTGVACEFPDGYVDPYPEAFARLEAFAMKGRSVAALFTGAQSADSVRMYFENLAQVSALLRTMAEAEKTGMPFSAEQLAFLNDAVRMSMNRVCGSPPTYDGWYTRLLFGRGGEMDPAIADVHTDSRDGAPVVLHVATGLPRLMVVTRESCNGPHAYAGLAFAYHEIVKAPPRLSDQEWAPMAPMAADVAFMKPILP